MLIVTERPRVGKWRGYIEFEGPRKDGNINPEHLTVSDEQVLPPPPRAILTT